MRGDVAIRCQGLGKQYRLGPRQRYRALRDTLPALALAPFRGLRSAIGFGRPTAQGATLWALRDVSFEVSARSEEHTSELQSRLHLVCRLLLEKKKNNNRTRINT